MDLNQALRLARQRVAALWPELSAVEPRVDTGGARRPSPKQLRRLNLPAAAQPPAPAEVTFTFAGQFRTPEGDSVPRVARVTVRDGRGVVRATLSR